MAYVLDPERFKQQHGYEVENVWYPRVTSIVQIKAKPALYRWYGNMASFAEGNVAKGKSASEGTQIHNLIEQILLGEEPRVPVEFIPAAQAFLRFKRDKELYTKPEWVEQRIRSHQHRYAGTMDVLARIGGKLGILDIKTSSAIYRDYNLQTSAYLHAVNESGFMNMKLEEPAETRWILRVDQERVCQRCGAKSRTKGGNERVKGGDSFCQHEWGPIVGVAEFQEFPEFEGDFQAFLSAKRLWEWENEEPLKAIGYL